MPDTTDLQAPAWPAPDPQLAEALRAYGFEATPPPIDDEPEADARPDVLDASAPEPVVVAPAASEADAWWVEAPEPEVTPPASVPVAPSPTLRPTPRPVATPATPAAAVGPTPPPFLAGRIARTPADGASPRPGPSPEATAGLTGLAAFATAAPGAALPPAAAATTEPEVATPIAAEPAEPATAAPAAALVESIPVGPVILAEPVLGEAVEPIAEPLITEAVWAAAPAELPAEAADAEAIAAELREPTAAAAPAEPTAAAGPAEPIAAEPAALADDPRAAIAWPEPQPLNDEQWRNAEAVALPADPWTAPSTAAAVGFAFEAAPDAESPAEAPIGDPWAGIRFSADDAPAVIAETAPDEAPAGWPGAGATSSAWGEPAPWAQAPSSLPDALDAEAVEDLGLDVAQVDGAARAWPDENTAVPVDAGSIETDAWATSANEAPIQTDLAPAQPMPWSDAIPAEHAPWESEPAAEPWTAAPAERIAADPGAASGAWTDAPGVEPAVAPQVDLSGVEFLGYQDDAVAPPSSLPPVVAPAVAAQEAAPILAQEPGSAPSDPYRRSIAEIGRRPPGARPVTSPPAPTPVSSGERTPPPDPAAASGATPAATGADLWDLVTGPATAAPAPVPAPKKASRVTTFLLTLLVVLVILALVLGFLWSFTDLIR